MEINSKINNSNYMYIRDATKEFLGEEVKYLAKPNCIIVYNKNVKYSELIKNLKLAIRELILIEEHNIFKLKNKEEEDNNGY